MSSLIVKKLTTLQPGTNISLTYPLGAGRYEAAAGVIMENNFMDGLAVVTREGEQLLIDYGAVSTLRLSGTASGMTGQPAAPQSAFSAQTAQPVSGWTAQPSPAQDDQKQTAQTETAVAAAALSPAHAAPDTGMARFGRTEERNAFPPLRLAADVPALSDRELRELFNRLPKKDRKRLNGSYDSFKYGVKCTDREKMASAADAAARTLLDGCAKGYVWDRSASRFCGALYRRAGQSNVDVYVSGKWYWEAAWCACKAGLYEDAGACASLALLEAEWRHGEDLLEIIRYSASVTYDLSCVRFLWERIPDRMTDAMPALLEALYAARKVPYPAESDISEALTSLKPLYPNDAMGKRLSALLPEETVEEEEETPPPRIRGWVRRYDRFSGEGEVVSVTGGPVPGWHEPGTGSYGTENTAETVWSFKSQDAANGELRERLNDWSEGDSRTVLWTEFTDRDGRPADMVPARSPLAVGRQLAESGRYQEAIEQFAAADGTPDGPEAMGQMVRAALEWDKAESRRDILVSVAEYCDARNESYPPDAWHTAMRGQLSFTLGDNASAVEYMRRSLDFPRLSPKLRVTFLAHSMRYCICYYEENPNRELMEEIRERADEWLRLFRNSSLEEDIQCQRYYPRVLRWKCRAGCELDLPEEAEQDYLSLLREFPYEPSLPELRDQVREVKKRCAKAREAVTGGKGGGDDASGESEDAPPQREEGREAQWEQQALFSETGGEPDGSDGHPSVGAAETAEPSRVQADGGEPDGSAADRGTVPGPDASTAVGWYGTAGGGWHASADGGWYASADGGWHGTAGTEEPSGPPCADPEGWDALHMTAGDIAAIAFGASVPEDIPAAVACLRAGAALNPELLPLSRTVSLAADDPLPLPADLTAQDSSAAAEDGTLPTEAPVLPSASSADGVPPTDALSALLSLSEEGDPAWPALNDCCAAAVLLRMSFREGRERDYSFRTLREGLSVTRELPLLAEVLDRLDQFRQETECGMNAYAVYRNQEARHLREELDDTVRTAGELYRKYILSPPRESARFKRLLETKKLLFAQDGELSRFLRMVSEEDAEGLEREKTAFSEKYLNGSTDFDPKQISVTKVDALIGSYWDQSLKTIQIRKNAAVLQGNRRNNLRSAISEILGTVCRWYDLTERGSGFLGWTEEGEALYQRMEPELSEKLRDLSAFCLDAAASAAPGEPAGQEPGYALGLLLIGRAARELSARLDGSWRDGEERELYAPLLLGDQFSLDGNLFPDLTATFCGLPEFNFFARARAFLAAPKKDYPERLAEIYGPDREHSNYGTASQIVAYLRRTGREASLPENAARFAAQSGLQAEMRLQAFREELALAENRGQISRQDPFCSTLDAAAVRWYRESVRTGNFGFFFALLRHAEARMRESGQRYGARLLAQLDALSDSRPSDLENGSDSRPSDSENRSESRPSDLENLSDSSPSDLENRSDSCLSASESRAEFFAAVRRQIAEQNYIAAEDYLAGAFTPDVPRPAALDVLSDFLARYAKVYRRVADTGRTLAALLDISGSRPEAARRLTESWIDSAPVTEERVSGLLALLGWRNPAAERMEVPGGSWEVYRVTAEADPAAEQAAPSGTDGTSAAPSDTDGTSAVPSDTDGTSAVPSGSDGAPPSGPAETFRASAERGGLYAVCLSGVYDCARLCQTMEALDALDGNKVLLLDCALGETDRRALARAAWRRTARDVTIVLDRVLMGYLAEVYEPEQVNGTLLAAALPFAGCAPFGTEDADTEPAVVDSTEPAAVDGTEPAAVDGTEPAAVDGADPTVMDGAETGSEDGAETGSEDGTGPDSTDGAVSADGVQPVPLTAEQARDLLVLPLADAGIVLPDQAVLSQILATCLYLPGPVRRFGRRLAAALRDPDYAGYDVKSTPPYTVSTEHLRRVLADRPFLDSLRREIRRALGLDRNGRRAALVLLLAWMDGSESTETGYSGEDILRHASELGIGALSRLDGAELDGLLRELRAWHVLRSVGDGHWLLATVGVRDLLGSDGEIFDRLTACGEVAA